MKRKTITLNIIGFLLLIIGYSYFRSYIDQIKFIVALDKVISTIISEAWKLLSSPTIFIALIIVILIFLFKENLQKLFPAIKEIKAGSFSAIIDSSQLGKLLISQTDDLELEATLDSKKKKEDVLEFFW
jgi:hypothetical protein